jgi:hypothetical protein
VPPDDPHAGPPDPEQDPDAALEALASDDLPAGRSRRRLARAALEGLRQARRTARIGVGLAALALLAAVALAVFTLTRESDTQTRVAEGGDDAGAIVAGARPATVLVRARGVGGASFGSGVVIDADEGLVLTNFHVIGSGGDIEAGRPGRLEPATVRGAAPCDDLALLEVEGLGRLRGAGAGRPGRDRSGRPGRGPRLPGERLGRQLADHDRRRGYRRFGPPCGCRRQTRRAFSTCCRLTRRSTRATPAGRSWARTASS